MVRACDVCMPMLVSAPQISHLIGAQMSVEKETIARIAHLARLKLGEDQLESMTGEMNNILAWIEQLSEVPTDDVEPMTSVVHKGLPQRDDAVTAGADRNAILDNAPSSEHGFYTVPKVIE